MSGATSRTGSSAVTSATAMRQETASPASLTTTITRQPQTLVLRLNRRPNKKKVTWKEGTVDNEFLQRKSSKKCCIFHKDKPFDEDDTDDDDGACSHHHDPQHFFDGACSSKGFDAGD